jgi:hypothetical protein
MRLRSLFPLLLAPVLLGSFVTSNYGDTKPSRIFAQMYDSIGNIKTIRQKCVAIERVESRFSTSSSEQKINISPRKIYFRNPVKKLEILYDSEVSAHKALVKPHVFPYIAMTLDPMGNLMRRNQHYTINELGYDFIGKSIALTINKDREGINNFVYHGRVTKNGYSCYLLQYENKSYSYTNYTVLDKETATSIAYKLCVNDYLLRYRNNLLNDFGYLKKGTVLQVPTLYCKKAVLYIDEKLMLPVALSLYDDTGLFESYEYTQIVINKPFRADEFDKDFKEYDF